MNEALRTSTEEHIQMFGRSVIAVMGGRNQTFAYSIGNAKLGLPEFLVIGIDPRIAQRLINMISDQMVQAGVAPATEAPYSFGGEHPAWLIAAGAKARSEYTIQAGQFFGTEDYPLIQIILCDRNGRFPWDADCEPVFKTQPVLR